ncbi:GGDEF domain-containing protein [Candidatus Thiodiazotropha sp. CDECU1]|uniref:GGDEF domain-containing protein n=1 Tax=Candidatus Thiodiazotropha sp. CDECU1 TaxID=3065865 RepID=UPI00292DBCC0|nr:GGDEF domain-containing protein [Candidatus Thiodiazotropha sp. CDECU1]
MSLSNELDKVFLDDLKPLQGVPEQTRLRLLRVVVVGIIGISYLLDAILLFLFTLTDTIYIHVPLYYGLAGLGHVLTFSSLHWSGFSERFENPHMTLWQMVYAICTVVLGLMLAPQISIFFLGHLIVIFTFGALRIRLFELISVWLVTAIAISLAIVFNHNAVPTLIYDELIVSLLVMVSFSLFLLRAIAIGYYGYTMLIRMFNKRRIFENEASHDVLTGIYNRRNLRAILAEQFSLHSRKAIPCSLAMIDVDHFKLINDGFGHVGGDEVLKGLVGLLRHEIRESDKLIRYGGEEFIIIMAATNLSEAEIHLERIRKCVEQFHCEVLPDDFSLTISIGLTEMMEQDQSDDLIGRADSALYTAKRAGRNRTVVQIDNLTEDHKPVFGE